LHRSFVSKSSHINGSGKEIIKRVGDLSKHLQSYQEYHSKLGSALGTVVNHYNFSNKEFKKIDKDVLRIYGESPNLEILTLEKPLARLASQSEDRNPLQEEIPAT